MSETTTCPDCAEEIGADDAKCRHCGANFRKQLQAVSREPEMSCMWALVAWVGMLGTLLSGLFGLLSGWSPAPLLVMGTSVVIHFAAKWFGKRELKAGGLEPGFLTLTSGTASNLGCVAFLVMLLAGIGMPSLIEPRIRFPESGAIGSLKTIGTAQSLFREADKEADGNLDYGTLAELRDAGATGLIDSILGSGTKNGYLFAATYGSMTSEFIWFAIASPQIPTTTGDRYFCTNHEGVTYYTSSGPFQLNSVNCTIPAEARPVGK